MRALYGLLMILPQSEAFRILKQRLDCVPNYFNKIKYGQSLPIQQSNESTPVIDFKQLLDHFQTIQNKQSIKVRSKHVSFLSNISN